MAFDINSLLAGAGGFGQSLLATAGPQPYPMSPLATIGGGLLGAQEAIQEHKTNLAAQELADLERQLIEQQVAAGEVAAQAAQDQLALGRDLMGQAYQGTPGASATVPSGASFLRDRRRMMEDPRYSAGRSMVAGMKPDALDFLHELPPDRRIIEGVDGRQYYADTGERVLPGVKATPKLVQVWDDDLQQMVFQIPQAGQFAAPPPTLNSAGAIEAQLYQKMMDGVQLTDNENQVLDMIRDTGPGDSVGEIKAGILAKIINEESISPGELEALRYFYPTRSITLDKGKLTITDGHVGTERAAEVKRQDMFSVAANAVRRTTELIALLDTHGASAIGFSATLAQWSEGFVEQVNAIIGSTIGTEGQIRPASEHDFSGFGKIAVDSAEFRQGVYRLAVMNAKAFSESTGKALSDKDVTRELKALSGGKGDPESTRDLIIESTLGMVRDMQTQFRVSTDNPEYDLWGELVRYGTDISLFESGFLEDAALNEGLVTSGAGGS
jgi:hypothetical protein